MSEVDHTLAQEINSIKLFDSSPDVLQPFLEQSILTLRFVKLLCADVVSTQKVVFAVPGH